MPNCEHNHVDMTVPPEKLESTIHSISSDTTCDRSEELRFLGFIHLRYLGFTVTDASGIMGISRQTGYNWQNDWAEHGLSRNVIGPSRGRPSRITADQKMEFVETVADRRLSTKEARELMRSQYGIAYTEKHIHVILSSSGLNHIDSPSADGTSRMVWSRTDY